MAPARQRVSYVIPPPAEPVPRYQLPLYGLPRLGSSKPLLIHLDGLGSGLAKANTTSSESHPRHRLGVASLALDTYTQLAGRSTPEGILYTGGRDGTVISWDLEISMKKRSNWAAKTQKGRWEMITGWGNDAIDEENEDDIEDGLNNFGSDGDVLGDVTDNFRKRRRPSGSDPSLHEQLWEIDSDSFGPGKVSTFRQCAQMHSDWVNDILLCNQGQTVVSASSDGTVKVWNPHSDASGEPSVVGSHSDYVRCLSHCHDQNWIASGSFDRTIKLWDLSRASPSASDPLITLKSPEASGPKASVYALAVDPYGSIVASGSPERVVRTWDPRSGKRTNKLVGHTDNIRAILVSDDARYLLTGSADASVKLWSLASQRCIHTFTQHTESVWSLFSSHPSLEIFYSGDKSGLVCRVDVEGCSDVSEGECIVLCQDASDRTMASTEGINKMVAMDNDLLWTASGSSSVKRWRIPQRRTLRAPSASYFSRKEMESPISSGSLRGVSPRRKYSASINNVATTRAFTPPPMDRARLSLAPSFTGSLLTENAIDGDEILYGIPFKSLVRLTSANESFAPLASIARGRDPEVATLYSAASVMSIPQATRPQLQTVFQQAQQSSLKSTSPIRSDIMMSRNGGSDEVAHPIPTARVDYEEREVASDAVPLLLTPDDIIYGNKGLVRSVMLNDRMHALTVDTTGEVAVWDIIRCACLGRFAREDVAAASNSGHDVNGNGHEKEQSPREALEIVKERIEGEAVVTPWSSTDTKTGLLTVHLDEKCFDAEIYADEAGYGPERHFNDETRMNLGKWILRNLFLGFVREHQRALSRRNREANNLHDQVYQRAWHKGTPTHIQSNGDNTSNTHRRSNSDDSRKSGALPSSTVLASPSMVPAISPNISATHKMSPLLTPMIPLQPIVMDNSSLSISHFPNPLGSNDPTPTPTRPPTAPSGSGFSKEPSEYFSQPLRTRSGSVSAPGTSTDEAGKTPFQDAISAGGLIGRLRNFTKSSSRRHNSELGSATVVTSGETATNVDTTAESSTGIANAALTPLQLILSHISIPPSSEAPGLALPTNTSILISEECPSGWATAYRGSVAVTGIDAPILEETMPMWVLQYLLTNKAPVISVSKIGFVLLPYPSKDSEEQLPELLNTSQSKLTASRFLRVRKLTNHVQDKLEKMGAGVQTSNGVDQTPRSSSDTYGRSSPALQSAKPRVPRAEDLFEILCNDTVLPLDMTLAAVRQFVWRQASELTMHYRRKTPARIQSHISPSQVEVNTSELVTSSETN